MCLSITCTRRWYNCRVWPQVGAVIGYPAGSEIMCPTVSHGQGGLKLLEHCTFCFVKGFQTFISRGKLAHTASKLEFFYNTIQHFSKHPPEESHCPTVVSRAFSDVCGGSGLCSGVAVSGWVPSPGCTKNGVFKKMPY